MWQSQNSPEPCGSLQSVTGRLPGKRIFTVSAAKADAAEIPNPHPRPAANHAGRLIESQRVQDQRNRQVCLTDRIEKIDQMMPGHSLLRRRLLLTFPMCQPVPLQVLQRPQIASDARPGEDR